MSEDNFSFQDESVNKYFTQIPNILAELELSPSEFRLYFEYKRIAGEKGACWKSLMMLSQEIGIGQRTIQECNKTLSEPRDKLGGLSLIKLIHRFKDDGSRDTSVITIVDIWPINMTYFSLNRGGGAKSAPPLAQNLREGGAKFADKQEPSNNNPNNNNNSSEPVVVVSSENDDEKRKMLVEFAFDSNTLTHLCTFSLEVISQALEAYRSQAPGKIVNKSGYMRNAIENGWKAEKSSSEDEIKNEKIKQINENSNRCKELYEKYKPYIKFKGILDFKICDDAFEIRPYNGSIQRIPFTETNCIAILHNYIDNAMKIINNSRETNEKNN